MPQHKFINRFLSSGMQVVALQVLGGVFFYIISIYLPKDIFGAIGWMNAVSVFVTTLLGIGLEQVVVRRISASNRSDWAAGAFFFHSLASFLLAMVLVLLISHTIWHNNIYHLLPWFFAAQGIIYVGVPLKQFLNAKEIFAPYGIIALLSNAGKIVAVFLMQRHGDLDIHGIMLVLIVSAVFELICLLLYVVAKTDISFRFKISAYRKLIREALPQYISVIFDMSLSRIDWILLGIIASATALADYSFAYRAFEIARLPVNIIAPVILPRLSRLAERSKDMAHQQSAINSFNNMEAFVATGIILGLNILWVPLVSFITHGKYGYSNAGQFMLLSLCVPMLFFINLGWSLCFSLKKYKQLSAITVSCAVINIGLNLVLIPFFGGMGAAVAFGVTTLVQACLYYRLTAKYVMRVNMLPLVIFLIAAIFIYLIVNRLNISFIVQFLIAMAAYIIIAWLTGYIGKKHILNFKQLLA